MLPLSFQWQLFLLYQNKWLFSILFRVSTRSIKPFIQHLISHVISECGGVDRPHRMWIHGKEIVCYSEKLPVAQIPPIIPSLKNALNNLSELERGGFAVWLNTSLHVMTFFCFWWELRRTSTPFVTVTVLHNPSTVSRGSRVSFSSWRHESLTDSKPL